MLPTHYQDDSSKKLEILFILLNIPGCLGRKLAFLPSRQSTRMELVWKTRPQNLFFSTGMKTGMKLGRKRGLVGWPKNRVLELEKTNTPNNCKKIAKKKKKRSELHSRVSPLMVTLLHCAIVFKAILVKCHRPPCEPSYTSTRYFPPSISSGILKITFKPVGD